MSLHIGGLSAYTQKEDLEREFGRFGNLTNVWIADKPPGYAFITFENAVDAEEAIKELNGILMDGFEIRVEKSRTRSKRGRNFGRSGRGEGFRGGYSGRGDGFRGGHGGRSDGFRGGRGNTGDGFRGSRGGRGGFGRRQHHSFDSSCRRGERAFFRGSRSYGSRGYEGGPGYRSRSPADQRYDQWYESPL